MKSILLMTLSLNYFIPYSKPFISFIHPHREIRGQRRLSSRKEDISTIQNKISKLPKPKIRKYTKKRHPRDYWSNLSNLEKELQEFWQVDPNHTSCNNSYFSLAIPNESLLNFYKRHDLRYAISYWGGRTTVSYLLNNATIIPGRWKDAIQYEQVKNLFSEQSLIKKEDDMNIPPISPQIHEYSLKRKENETNSTLLAKNPRYQTGERWKHDMNRRKSWGFWTLNKLHTELYNYLKQYKEQYNRPSIYMPRLSELKHNQRDDIVQAIYRFYTPGKKHQNMKFSQKLQLISFEEWNYFEQQFLLLQLLRDYFQKNQHLTNDIMPTLISLERNNYTELSRLISTYGGGRILLAHRLGMRTSKSQQQSHHRYGDKSLHYGHFSLEFAMELMEFVRERLLEEEPPYSQNLVISMPTEEDFLDFGREDLLEDVELYGGFECVARRLGLHF